MTRAEQLDLFDGRRRKRQPAAPRATEYQEQVALMQWARLSERVHPELALLYHIPNGEQRLPHIGAKLQRMGLKKGVPDLDLPVARGPWHGLRIELKRAKEKPSPEQEQWIADLRAQGYRVEVCHGWMAARDLIIEYLETRA